MDLLSTFSAFAHNVLSFLAVAVATGADGQNNSDGAKGPVESVLALELLFVRLTSIRDGLSSFTGSIANGFTSCADMLLSLASSVALNFSSKGTHSFAVSRVVQSRHFVTVDLSIVVGSSISPVKVEVCMPLLVFTSVWVGGEWSS